ncbi:hypothetical protein B296_00058803 [Ensete ventricosum]|uniref:Uncharacterized protein n=1 Tax=Ensete ventricosum TaxID=4639 RepID=A0A426X5R3_ENSVE|nr:hypothetical protein B296_00058803 [Ensete ventricosum]
MEATTSSSIEPLLPSKALYADLSHAGDKLRNFQSFLEWMCVVQSDARHMMVS